MVILPSTYLPSIEMVSHLLQGKATIDLGENYIKRSPRNRARIMTAGGVMELTVHLRHANRPRTPMRVMEIDYSKRWQHQHRIAIISAYRSAPYFDHYWPIFEPLFDEQYELLHELNDAALRLIVKALGAKNELLRYSQEYISATEDDLDLRLRRRTMDSAPHFKPYIQVFYDRHPFAENLSILDAIFNEGNRCREAALLEF